MTRKELTKTLMMILNWSDLVYIKYGNGLTLTARGSTLDVRICRL